MEIKTKRDVFVTLTLTEKEANYIKHICSNPIDSENDKAKSIREELYGLLRSCQIEDLEYWLFRESPVQRPVGPLEKVARQGSNLDVRF